MKKVTTIVLIALVAISLFQTRVGSGHPQKDNPQPVLNGNKTIRHNLAWTNGSISPGHSPGKIVVMGDFALGNSATYTCELKDLTGGGTGHDQIAVSGNVALDGTLNIVLDGYTPNNADMFDIITYGGSLSGSFSTVNGLPAGWLIDYGVIAPGKVSVYGPNSPLPITLLHFNAQKDGHKVFLSWQTISEQNSDYFLVERSNDGTAFSACARVNAQGQSSGIHHYSTSDDNPAKGINYYRLKQVDRDAKFTYSGIISVDMTQAATLFFPNPAHHTIFFSDPVFTVIIRNTRGRVVLKKQGLASKLDISSLPPGAYVIDINHKTLPNKLIVK